MKKFFLLFFILTASAGEVFTQKQDSILMTIGDVSIPLSEFRYIYEKNNQNNRIDSKSLDEYLELFENFKLKVIEAEQLGLDTFSSFTSELKSYRSQLAKLYMTDSKKEESLLREAYQRLHEDVNVSHVLVLVPQTASPKDTLVLYRKALDVRRRLLKEDFETVARELSEDPSVARNGGNLGYITSTMTIYPFETTAYNLQVGEVSQPVRTQIGYHLIRVNDRRPAVGEIHAAHIMKVLPRDVTDEDKNRLKSEMDSIRALLKNGADFGELAKQLSDDKQTGANGGDLSWFGIGRMVNEFEMAAFSLKDPGQISDPILSPYGWHIIKLIEKRGVPSFENKKPELQRVMQRDGRAVMGVKSLVEKLKIDYSFAVYENALRQMSAAAEAFAKNDSLFRNAVLQMNKPLFSFANQRRAQSDFAAYLIKNEVAHDEWTFNRAFSNYVEQEILQYEDSQLEKKYPEFKNLVQEYHDGILLFEISNREVWEKASADVEGLRLYFESNKEKYAFSEPRFKGFIVSCRDKKMAKQLKKILQNSDPDSIESYVRNRINLDSIPFVKIKKGLWMRGESSIVDNLAFGQEQGVEKEAGFPIVFLQGKQITVPEEYTEVKGTVVSDYQNYLDSRWIASLREKYPIKVDFEMLKSLQNK